MEVKQKGESGYAESIRQQGPAPITPKLFCAPPTWKRRGHLHFCDLRSPLAAPRNTLLAAYQI